MASLWISDTHIGNPSSKLDGIFKILTRKEWQDVYLVGDIFDLDAMNDRGETSSEEKQLLQWIVDRGNSGKNITWLPGNHDRAIKPIFEQLHKGITFADEVTANNCWTVHGDRYDLVYQTFKSFTSWGGGSVGMNFWYNLYTRLGMWRTRMARQAHFRGCKTVICGHIHLPEDRMIKGIRYINLGDWVGSSTWLEEELGVYTLYQLREELIVPWGI